MKTTTTTTTVKVVELSKQDAGKLLCDGVASQANADGSLGAVTSADAKDTGGLTAEVTLTFVKEEVT